MMPIRRPALGLAAAALAATACAGFIATPASAATAAAATPTTKTQVVFETTLRSNAEAAIDGFTCSDPDYPYLLDRAHATPMMVPNGVSVLADQGLIVVLKSAPTLSADGLVTGWTADPRKASVFHPDFEGTAGPKSVTVTATCTSDPDAAYAPA
jgi:hypothetical protein